MWVDIIVLLYVLFITYMGYRQGMLKQVLSIVALLLAYFFAGPLASLMERFIKVGIIPNLILAAIVIYVAARIVFWLVNSQLGKRDSGDVKGWNHNLGTALGMAKAMLFAWLVLCVLVTLFVDAFPGSIPTLHDSLKSSAAGRIASVTNPFQGAGRAVQLLSEVMSNEEMKKRFLADKAIQEFANDPSVKRYNEANSLPQRLRAINSKLVRRLQQTDVVAALERAAGKKPTTPEPGPDGASAGDNTSHTSPETPDALITSP